jgi:hypothetical protein
MIANHDDIKNDILQEDIPPHTLHQIIKNYLNHHCYSDTLVALTNVPTEAQLTHRQTIMNLVKTGNVNKATDYLHFNLPEIFDSCYATDIKFELKTMEFIELIKQKDLNLLEFGQTGIILLKRIKTI